MHHALLAEHSIPLRSSHPVLGGSASYQVLMHLLVFGIFLLPLLLLLRLHFLLLLLLCLLLFFFSFLYILFK